MYQKNQRSFDSVRKQIFDNVQKQKQCIYDLIKHNFKNIDIVERISDLCEGLKNSKQLNKESDHVFLIDGALSKKNMNPDDLV